MKVNNVYILKYTIYSNTNTPHHRTALVVWNWISHCIANFERWYKENFWEDKYKIDSIIETTEFTDIITGYK